MWIRLRLLTERFKIDRWLCWCRFWHYTFGRTHHTLVINLWRAARYFNFFFYQPSSVLGWTSAFLLAVLRLCGVIEGRLSHFLPRWLRIGWQSVISQGKIPWNTQPWLGIEPGPQGGKPVSYPTELSWPGPQGGHTVIDLSLKAIEVEMRKSTV